MTERNRGKLNSRLLGVFIILILSGLITSQAMQVSHAQSDSPASGNQWAMTLQAQGNGQNEASNVFAPFDQINLYANVTYGNAGQPDVLVSFKVQGPANFPNQINITRIEITNNEGIAEFSYRLPIDGQDENSVVGTWQAFATLQTTNGTIEENLTFPTQWGVEIRSINLQDSQGQNRTIFSKGDAITAQLALTSNQSQTANITLNLEDSAGNQINQTEIQNIALSDTAQTQASCTFTIPNNVTPGQAVIIVRAFSGTYQGVEIPASQTKTAKLGITSASSTSPTSSPNPTPSSPPPSENAVSLFSWLLVATGFFTFTLLQVFLKRKPMSKLGTQTPKLPSAAPVISTPPAIAATILPEANPKVQTLQTAPATLPTQETPIQKSDSETIPSQAFRSSAQGLAVASLGTKDTSGLEDALTQKRSVEAMLTHMSRISSTANRVQALKLILKSEESQLAKDLQELSKIIDEEEKMINTELVALKQEIARLTQLTTEEKPSKERSQSTENSNAENKANP